MTAPTETRAPQRERSPEVLDDRTNAGFQGASARLDPSQTMLIELQQSVGNTAVTDLLSKGRPADSNGIQRAPADSPALDVDARVDRLRHAIEFQPVLVRMAVDIEDMATALAGMTKDEGRAVKKRFEELTSWNLGWLISGELEIGDVKIGNDIGPKNRKRLLNLLSGTAVVQEDPVAAMAQAEAIGQQFGSMLGIGDAVASAAGAQAFVETRDRNIAREKEAAPRRLTAQAIEVKGWMDKGKKEKIFALLRALSTPDKREERSALDKAFEAEFKDTLYIALTKKFKGRDWDQLGALWDGDIAKADALATEGKIEKLREAEAQTKAISTSFLAGTSMGKDATAKVAKKEQDARASLEQHLDELAQQPAKLDEHQGKNQLEAMLDEGSHGGQVRQSLKTRKDVAVDELLAKDKRPELLASRLARSEREGTLKATDVENAIGELRAMAETEAAREAAAPPVKVLAQVGTTTAPVEKPPISPRLLADSYLARFEARFDAESPRPLSVVVMSKGSLEERERNAALYVNAGDIPEWKQLYFAIRAEKKDLDRVRRILGGKSKADIQTLAKEYSANTPDKRDMAKDLLGSVEYQQRIRHPTADDFMKGRLPKDLGQARTDSEEMRILLNGGGVFEPSQPSGGDRAAMEVANELIAAQQDDSGSFGPKLPTEVVKSIAKSAAQGTTVRELREEAKFVFARITQKGVSTEYNRGTFARGRDWLGNVEYSVLKQTGYDANAAMKALDDALYQDPPDLQAAAKVVSKLYMIEARIKHNIGVYQERTEAAFNAFVDAAVMIATTLATAGQGGAILMAIRATAATIATKVTLKGGDYSADEFWGDVRGGVFNAMGGKLSEKLVGGLSNAIAVRYAARAERLKLTNSWRTWLTNNAGAAAKWEAENLVSGVSAGLAEAVVTDNDEAIYTPMSLGSHIESAGQDLAQKGIRGTRAARARNRQKKARAKAEQAAVKQVVAPDTEPLVAAPAVETPAPTAPTPTSGGVPRTADVADASGAGDRSAGGRRPSTDTAPTRRGGDDDPTPTKSKTQDELGDAADAPRIAARPSETGRPIEALSASTGPDARARIKAAEFESIYDKWEGMEPEQRRAEIERLLNDQLVREGGHPIKVKFGPMKAGDADFTMGTWTVRISTESLSQGTMTIREFAVLTGAAVHEARHALHFFRAVRVGLARGNLTTAPIDAGVLARAREANKLSDPQDEFSPQAHDELLEIADVSFNKERRKKKHGPDAIDPDKVIDEMNTTKDAAREAADKYDKALEKVTALEAAGKAGTQEHIDAHREATAAYNEAAAKYQAAREAYLKYPALPEETEAWRIQLATEAAVEERLMTRTELKNAQRARQLAAQERRMARERKDPGAAAALAGADARLRLATTEVQRLQKQLDNLARGGEPKALRVAPEAPAPRRTNVNVVRRQPARDVGDDTQVDLAPAGGRGAARQSQSGDARPLPRQSSKSPPDSAPKAPGSTPTAPDPVRSILGGPSSDPATVVPTGTASVRQGTGTADTTDTSGTSGARTGVFGPAPGGGGSASPGSGSTVVRSQLPPVSPPSIGSGGPGGGLPPIPAGGGTGGTPTIPQPASPTQLGTGQQFKATAGSEANRLSPRVERIGVEQWSSIQTVGEGNNLKYLLTDAVTGERWMFKPAAGEEGMLFGPDLGIQAGERWRRALAAAHLSQDLGLNTPFVRLVEINGIVGSLQEWRQGYEARPTTKNDKQAEFDRFWNSRHRHDIDAFDYFIANQDRHERNVMIRMVDGQPRTMLIDQDAGMPPTPDRFSREPPPAGQDLGRWQRDMPPSVSGELADRFRDLAAHFPEAELRKWLTGAEVDGLWARLNQVVDGLNSGRIGIITESPTRGSETAPRPGTGPGRPPTSGGGGGTGGGGGGGAGGSGGAGGGSQTPAAPSAMTSSTSGGAQRVNVNVVRRPPTTGTTARTGSPTSTDTGTTADGGTPTLPKTSGATTTADDTSTIPRPTAGTSITGPAPSRADPMDLADPTRTGQQPNDYDPISQKPPPRTDKSADQVGIVPGSKLDTETGRANRAEQQRRAAENQIDQLSMQGRRLPSGDVEEGTRPDAGARARAADYAQLYRRWEELGPAGRRELVTSLINAQLAREGIPPVKVTFGGKTPGSAEFAHDSWTMALSADTVDAKKISIKDFATLVDNAVHETQHAVTNFRGLRVALAAKKLNPAVYIPDPIVELARAANAKRHPNVDLDVHARKEAFEIYKVSMDPKRAMGEKVPPGGVNRAEVLARRDAAVADHARTKSEHAAKLREFNADPNDPILQRELRVTKANLDDAGREMIRAHNAYMALPEETFSWRAGSAAKAAIIERLTLEADLANAVQRATAAADEHRVRRAGRDMQGAIDALARGRQAREEASQIQARLDGLTQKEAVEIQGRVVTRGVPLTDTELAEAPKPPPKGYTDDDFGPGPARKPGPKPAESSPNPVIEDARRRTTPPPSPDAGGKDSPRKPAAPQRPIADPQEQPKRARNVAPTGTPDVPAKTSPDARPGEGKAPPPTDTPAPKAADVVSPGPQPLTGPRGNAQVGAADALTIDVDKPSQTPQGPKPTGWGGSMTGQNLQIEHRTGGPGPQKTAAVNITGQDTGVEFGRNTPGKGGPTAGFKLDSQGNPTVEVGWNVQGRGGSYMKPTFSHGTRVDAAEPVELEDGRFLVAYTMTETTTAGLGGGARKAPPSGFGRGAGANVSTSQAETKEGTRIFKTKPEAEAFRSTAALVLAYDTTLEAPKTADEATKIPIGETRGEGDTTGKSVGLSASFGGTTLGRNWQNTDTTGLSFYRVSGDLMNVTTAITNDKAKDWGISGLLLANQKGGIKNKGFAITVQFNLSTTEGRAAFDVYLATRIPPTAGKIVNVMNLLGEGDYDRYQMPGFGVADWSDKSWEKVSKGEGGTIKEFGGSQTHQQDPTWLAELTGDRELYSSAQLVSQQIRGKEKYTATINIKSESGEYNREQFGKIFMGAKAKGPVTQSGAWTLSAEIDKKVVDELARNSTKFKNAKDNDEKQRILSEVFRKSGAGMAGGLVRYGGRFMLAWDLELKGDPNFPGARGRDKLAMQREELAKKLKTSPEAAGWVVRDTQKVLDGLAERRKAVKNPEKYTDLPEELREQQLALIDRHIYEFNQVRSNALMAAGRRDPRESIEAIRARIDKPGAYDDLKADKRELAQLQDQIADKDAAINEMRSTVVIGWEALGRLKPRNDVPELYRKHWPASQERKKEANRLQKEQSDLGPVAQEQRNAAFNAPEGPAQIEALRKLAQTLARRLLLLEQQYSKLQEAGAEYVYITTEKSREGKRYDDFWAHIEFDVAEEEEVDRRINQPTAMALEEPAKKPKRGRRR